MSLKTRQASGAAAGGRQLFYRATDWYNSSENNFSTVFEPETHMCQISTTTDLRDIVVISPSPDPDDVFSKKLTQPIVGPSVLGNSNQVYDRTEVWMYLDKSKLPLVVKEFSADGKRAYMTSAVVGSFAEAGFKTPLTNRDGQTIPGEPMTVVIYSCTFVRVALSQNCFGAIAGAVTTYKCPNSNTRRGSAVVIGAFPKNLAGDYPKMTYLRMQKKIVKGQRELYVDYIPKQPIQGTVESPACNEFGIVRYEIDDLDLNTAYSLCVLDITALPTDSSTIKEKKANLKTLVFNAEYFAKLRRNNPGNATSTDCHDVVPLAQSVASAEALPSSSLAVATASYNPNEALFFWSANMLSQPFMLTDFVTPPEKDSFEIIRFIVGSCFAGTLDALDGAYKIPRSFTALLGDKSYNDNSRGSLSDFIVNYQSWQRNQNGQRLLISAAVVPISDDHECSDNWFRNIAISAFNSANIVLDAAENAIYEAVRLNPNTAPKIMFRKTNQFPLPLATSDRIRNAFEANDMFWPTKPHKIDQADMSANGCFTVRYGKMNLIVLISTAEQHADGSTTYNALEGTVSADGTTFTRPPNAGRHYLPPQSKEFLKKVLLNKKADCNVVLFSSDVSCLFNNRYDFLRTSFQDAAIAALRAVDPNAPIPLTTIESTFAKTFAAYNYDNPDGYHVEIKELVDWMVVNQKSNVFFCTGDPHSTLFKYLHRNNVIVSCCVSAVSTYRASGANLMLASNLDSENTIIAVSNNCYASMAFNPIQKVMDVELIYADDVRASTSIPLKPVGWFGPYL